MARAAIAQRTTTLKEAEDAFNLARTSDPGFFSEWQTNPPNLTKAEKALRDRVTPYLDQPPTPAASPPAVLPEPAPHLAVAELTQPASKKDCPAGHKF